MSLESEEDSASVSSTFQDMEHNHVREESFHSSPSSLSDSVITVTPRFRGVLPRTSSKAPFSPLNFSPASLCMNPVASTLESGTAGTLEYTLQFFDESGCEISPLHGIPLKQGSGLLTMVCTTPRDTWGEFECSIDRMAEPEGQNVASSSGRGAEIFHGLSPPARGVGRGCGRGPLKLREYQGKPSHFTENSLWNLGFLPQTWANPELMNINYGGLPYDGRPITVVDVGGQVAKLGEVYTVKPLAAFAMVTFEGGSLLSATLSWKIIAMRAEDLSAVAIDDVGDLHRRLPGVLEEVREWLRTSQCQKKDDKPCVFGRNERAAPVQEAMKAVAECHASWRLLVQRNPILLEKSLPKFTTRKVLNSLLNVDLTNQDINQGQLWVRRLPAGEVDSDGVQIELCDPFRWVKSSYGSTEWGEGSVLDGNDVGDTESNWSGTSSISGSIHGGSLRRKGLKLLRSSPLFSRPAYIEPREGDVGVQEDEEDWIEKEFNGSAACFPLPGKNKKPFGKFASIVSNRKWGRHPGGPEVVNDTMGSEPRISSWEKSVEQVIEYLITED